MDFLRKRFETLHKLNFWYPFCIEKKELKKEKIMKRFIVSVIGLMFSLLAVSQSTEVATAHSSKGIMVPCIVVDGGYRGAQADVRGRNNRHETQSFPRHP